jgi:hypothetical protein
VNAGPFPSSVGQRDGDQRDHHAHHRHVDQSHRATTLGSTSTVPQPAQSWPPAVVTFHQNGSGGWEKSQTMELVRKGHKADGD